MRIAGGTPLRALLLGTMLAAMRRTPGDQQSDRDRGLAKGFARTLAALEVRGARVLVAVSGGRDSCVLLDLFARFAPAFELELLVGHVHHGLRGVEADRDAEHVAALARAAGLAFAGVRIDPESATRVWPSRIRPTLEEAARYLRRAALAKLADEHACRSIATAHHAGDQAETLLLRLLRGTGPDGLAGMASKSEGGRWLKPLLAVSPDAIAEEASARRLVWREDASNSDRRFSRNRLRHEVLPTLVSQFNPQLLRALGQLAEAAREDRAWIEVLVEEAAKQRITGCGSLLRFAIEGWDELPEALARRVVRRGLVQAGLGRDVSKVQLLRVLAFLRRGRAAGRDKKMELPGGFRLRRVADHFELSTVTPSDAKHATDETDE